jgi:hypothetical protein
MKKNKIYTLNALISLVCVPLSTYLANAAEIFTLSPPPAISASDSANVNLLSGLPTFSQTDLRIGSGANSLSHTIASYDGMFWNFHDNFDIYFTPGSGGARNVTAELNTQVFRPNIYGDLSSGYSPDNNDGASLTHSNNKWVYTNRNGTVYTQDSITYPNGYKVSKIAQHSVSTNTGLQLKYIYKIVNANNYNGGSYEANNSSDLYAARYFPSSIIAINNAVEYCSPTSSSCTLTNTWPTVTYDWPYAADVLGKYGPGTQVGDGIFSVTDAENRKTTYKHELIQDESTCQRDFGIERFVSNPEYKTRITKVRSDDSAIGARNYKYDHHAQLFYNVGMGTVQVECRLRFSLIDTVDINGVEWSYNHDQPDTIYVQSGRSSNYQGRYDVVMQRYGTEYIKGQIETPHLFAKYYQNESNRVKSITVDGLKTEYQYDARGNITELKKLSLDKQTFITETAGFDVTCNNIKKCNKPNWTNDGRSKTTDYTYHPASGQIASITKPANEKNIRPQTRFTYERKYAIYKINGDTPEQSPDGIWLKATESHCINSAYNGSSCAGNDEVVTHFEYEPGNLFLVGVATTAQGKTQRTCYRYDIYGNQIGETRPKAGLTSCIY